MKKILCAFVALILVLALVPCVALAEDSINMSVEVSPDSLIAAGTVSVTITIDNVGDDIQNAVLYIDSKQVAELGNLLSGATKEKKASVSIPESKLGKNIKVQLQYEFAGQSKSISDAFVVSKKQANIELSSSVSVNKKTVAPGDDVTFTFTFENTGDVDIESAELVAPPLNNGNRIESKFTLQPGKTKTIKYEVQVSKNITVKPALTYTAAGSSKKDTLDSVSVKVQSAEVSLSLSANPKQIKEGDTVNFTLDIKNTGNVDLKNVKVIDPFEASVSTPSSNLRAGRSMSVNHSIQINKSDSMCFTVTCEDSNGNPYTYTSDPVAISLMEQPSETPTETIDTTKALAVSAIPQLEEAEDEMGQKYYKLPESGIVKWKIVVSNTGEVPIDNIKITESNLGVVVGTIPTLEKGDKEIEWETTVNQDTPFTFEASGTDANSTLYTAATDNIDVKIDGGDKETQGSPLGAMLWVIIVIVILIVGVGITLVVLMVRDKKAKKKAALAGQDEDLDAEEESILTAQRIKPASRQIKPEEDEVKPAPVTRRNVKRRGEHNDRNNF